IGEIESLLNEGTYSLPPSGLTTTPRGLFRTGKSMSPQGPAVRARHSTHFSCPPGFWTASRDTVLLTNEATYTEPPSGLTVRSSAPFSGASGTSPQPSEASFARQSSHLSWPPGLWAKKCETELLSWEATYTELPSGLTATPRAERSGEPGTFVQPFTTLPAMQPS